MSTYTGLPQTAALAGEDVASHVSVRKQFVGDHLTFSSLECRYFSAVALMPHGWCMFTWDMQQRELLIVDPLAYQPEDGYRSKSLEYAADTLHEAIFNCIEAYYTQWHCSRKTWSRRFLVLTTTSFTSTETGLCMVHIIRHFNGISLTSPLNKASLMEQCSYMLVELLHLEGNKASLQLEALECVANAVHTPLSDATSGGCCLIEFRCLTKF